MPSNTILILLTPVFILLASLMAESSDRLPTRLLSFTLPVLFVAPLVTGIPKVLRLQFSVTAMAVILIALAQSRAGRWALVDVLVTERPTPRLGYRSTRTT